MASARILLLVLLSCLVTNCNLHKKDTPSFETKIGDSEASSLVNRSPVETKASATVKRISNDTLQPTVDKIQASQTNDRKIIRNAEISLEMDTPREAQPKIAAIAERHGGFVVTSEFRQSGATAQASPSTVVNIILRVPARDFETVIEEIHRVGGHILDDKRSGQDVTEEYIDIEARLHAKRALEMQFLDIMRQAHKVSDALEVQTQLSEVRTEIEQLEGRRRFLENQSALSTIKVTLSAPPPVVTATTRGFFFNLKSALGDGVDIGSEIVLDLVRFAIVMIPITLFILLPAWFALKWLRKRVRWSRPAVAE
jgi:Domain of unknown function (DUF4349)